MISIIYFTSYGEKIANRLREYFDCVYTYDKSSYKVNMEKIFNSSKSIVFISSTGIAVRTISKFLKSKYDDPAVIVIDDGGNFVISLLSGHIGGANELCLKIANILKATPVITTSTDVHNIYAVDLFAKEHNMLIENKENLKLISLAMIEKKRIDLIKDVSVDYDYKFKSKDSEIALYITYKKVQDSRPHLILRPKVLNVGIGLKRGISYEALYRTLYYAFDNNDISINSIKRLQALNLKGMKKHY
ncbi:cobalamin biosynthesis central domain-containing protein [Caloramator sp. mosi_1]|uniref:cobalt-precorrin 5A hydrolase n=1 Tax=Caloramator sp. mosi_1 TaxID=3023090 RepID=UPI0023631258|nr:cobalamin biosynthesis central domain-containing protein [Caloramator sp. mosi_1]WDC84909.1 cobalamin biosynthesis central domain-containing protein [Caloramator sp. mosi_1]